MNTFIMKPTHVQNGADPYLSQKIMSASPEQLVVYIYDAGVAACAQKDKERALRVIQELINSLDFENDKSVTGTFYKMYRHLQELIHQEKFNEVKTVLSELRQTWATATKVY